MNPALRDILFKLGIALFVIFVPMAVAKLRGFDLREFFGFRRPSARLFAIFIAIWIGWMIVTELLLHSLQMDSAKPWPPYPLLVIILRVVAIGVLGPIGEELVFRGILYGRLAPRLGPHATIILLAVIFGLIHIRYDWATIAFVTVDGLLFGYARYKTGSVYTPMAMHAMGNLFSLWQSLNA